MAYYAPLEKTYIREGTGDAPPVNGTVKIRIRQKREDGSVITDSADNHPYGYPINLTNTTVQAPLVDELMQMRIGELATFSTTEGESFSSVQPDISSLEVEMLSHKGEDISTEKDGSLMKSVVVEGSGRGRPYWTGKCKVKVQSEGESEGREVVLRLGDGETYGVSRAVEQCAVTMVKGEQCHLQIRSSTSPLTITLLSLERDLTDKELYNMPPAELLNKAEYLKKCGNYVLGQSKTRLAALFYERALRFLDNRDRQGGGREGAGALELALHLNLAEVHGREGAHSAALARANSALWLEPDNKKGLFRRARANCALRFYEEAAADLGRLVELGERGVEVRQLQGKVREGRAEMTRSEGVNMRAVMAQIELEQQGPVEPIQSVWELAAADCPPELADEEAYAAYKGALEVEEKERKAVEAEKRAAELEANPPKKKKKRKKKKKNPEVVTVEEAEVVPVPAEEAPPPEPEVDEGMEYRVTVERSYVNKTEDKVYEGQVVNGEGPAQNGEGEKEESNSTITAMNGEKKEEGSSATAMNGVGDNEKHTGTPTASAAAKEAGGETSEKGSPPTENGAAAVEKAAENGEEKNVPDCGTKKDGVEGTVDCVEVTTAVTA